MENRDPRSLPPEAQEALRRKAVRAVLGGRTRTEVAELFGVTRQRVSLWVKAYLIVDGHPVHRARKVKAWLEHNADHIELFYLPGYSPNLSPDEILNQDVKANAVGRNRPSTVGELVGNVRAFLRSRQRRPHAVKRYFHERHLRYAAA